MSHRPRKGKTTKTPGRTEGEWTRESVSVVAGEVPMKDGTGVVPTTLYRGDDGSGTTYPPGSRPGTVSGHCPYLPV